MRVIPPAVKEILDKWNIRGLVILSLVFQTSLIFLAPLRKRTSKKLLAMILWTAYLLADWTANYAVAQITKNQGKEPKPDDPPKNKKLLALWAPFLLLHLGGPDTITALALEDNALWARHLFGLVSQALAGAYAVVQSMDNPLWPPIALLFITAVIKYTERTRALYTASLDKFKDQMRKPADTGPNYAKLMEEYDSRKDSNLPTDIVLIDEPDKHDRPPTLKPGPDPLNHLKIVQYGFRFFNTFKGLVVDLIFSFRERDESRDFFKELAPEDALRIIESELGFLYDSMYTKTAILHTHKGTVFRVIAFGSLLASFLVFHFRPEKSVDFHGADVVITYTLFIVGIALELSSLAMFLLSDWMFATMHACKGNRTREVLTTPFLLRRWSGVIYGFNFIGYCLKAKVSKINRRSEFVSDVKSHIDQIRFVSSEPLTRNQWEFIFSELKRKSEFAETPERAKKVSSARGEWVLQDSKLEEVERLMRYVANVDYDQSLLLWHIATELCFQEEEDKEVENGSGKSCDDREFSKIISDYMMYLLIMQPKLMSEVAGIGTIRFRDTLDEAKRFFKGRHFKNLRDMKRGSKMVLEVSNDIEPMHVKGDRSKSVLFDASMLAKELKRLDGNGKWRVLSKVWVELLSYAASHCKATEQVAQLSRGGELLNFVWLLMAHFGLADQFQINKGDARAKLVVGE
ncbi:BnaC07g18490D [Brassica napus]|uniref:BnaC07g18490D protein n=1 Tax=Brassica napus TaxID=3708 RepID=A0A078HMZ7_BRANA|nr:BnaC07g18490D [Brassica napus]